MRFLSRGYFLNQCTAALCMTLCLAANSAMAQTGGSADAARTESGEASFYHNKYQSRQTASGETFNQSAKTAAHRTLPFDTKVRVTNAETGDSVIVKINDRGPFVKGRVIDLSRSAFKAIGDVEDGTVPVEIEVLN